MFYDSASPKAIVETSGMRKRTMDKKNGEKKNNYDTIQKKNKLIL